MSPVIFLMKEQLEVLYHALLPGLEDSSHTYKYDM
jgi:hypothetical protein